MVVRGLLICLLAVGPVSLVASGAFAQPAEAEQPAPAPPPRDTAPVELRGRHSVTMGVGLLPDAQVSPGTVQSTGFLASVAYAYWPHDEWGLEASASWLDAKVAGGSAASITALLMGVSYHPSALAIGSVVRPYLSGAIGPYIGSETGGTVRTVGVRTTAVVGARLGLGVDAFAWRWLRLGVRAAYHATPKFGDDLGRLQDGSGGQLSLEIGVALGGR